LAEALSIENLSQLESLLDLHLKTALVITNHRSHRRHKDDAEISQAFSVVPLCLRWLRWFS